MHRPRAGSSPHEPLGRPAVPASHIRSKVQQLEELLNVGGVALRALTGHALGRTGLGLRDKGCVGWFAAGEVELLPLLPASPAQLPLLPPLWPPSQWW